MNNIEHNGPSENDLAWKAETQKEDSGVLEYETRAGDKVSLQWQESLPEKLKGSDSEAIIFLPGVALDGRSKPVVESAQKFADVSGLNSFSISTRLDNPDTENSQAAQAEAIQQFIASKGLTEITVVGNSQGANKSIDLIHELKIQNPDIKIRALIVTSPGGLIDQDGDELSKNFFKDALLNTPKQIAKNKGTVNKIKKMGNSAVLGLNVGFGIAKELATAPTEFGRRAKRESKEAATPNIHTEDVDVPVIVVMGSEDMAFPSGEMIPTDNIGILKINDAHGQGVVSQEMREQAFKKVFPNSPVIRALEGRKDPHGMHYLHGKVPEASWHMLERIERQMKKTESIED